MRSESKVAQIYKKKINCKSEIAVEWISVTTLALDVTKVWSYNSPYIFLYVSKILLLFNAQKNTLPSDFPAICLVIDY